MSRLRRLQRLGLAAGVAVFLALPGRAIAQSSFTLRGFASAGLDTNPGRIFGPTGADLEASGFLNASGRLSAGHLELGGTYGVAGRKFVRFPSEDMLAQEALAEVAGWPLRTVRLALGGRARDRRGGPWSFTDLQGTFSLRWRAVRELEVEVRAGAHRYLDRELFGYSFSAPEVGVSARYRLDMRHSFSFLGDVGMRRYNALAAPPDGSSRRKDGVLSAGASYSFQGGFQLSAGYLYFSEDSNSSGQTVRLHRLDLAYGTPLAWEWLLLTRLVLQLAAYPDGIALADRRSLEEDDERHNALSAKLLRPLSKQVDLELRYGLYVNVLPPNGTNPPSSDRFYQRHVVSVGLAARM